MGELKHDTFKTFESLKEYWNDDKQMIGDSLTREDVAYDVRSLLEYCDRLRDEVARLEALLREWVYAEECEWHGKPGEAPDFNLLIQGTKAAIGNNSEEG